MYYVYIVQCSNGKYYTGVTNDYQRRIVEHNDGRDSSSFTYTRRPVTLVYIHAFNDVRYAIRWEKILKKWSRAKKEAVIRGEFEYLPILSISAYRKRIDSIIVIMRYKISVMVSSSNHGRR